MVKDMRVLIQRVRRASVSVGGDEVASIGKGMLVLLGVAVDDTEDDLEWLVKRTVQLRIFDDEAGVMNLDVSQAGGEILVVSQFTLLACTKRGNRPSYIKAAGEEVAVPLYEKFVKRVRAVFGGRVVTGRFGADMQVELINDGPVTIWIDSRNRE